MGGAGPGSLVDMGRLIGVGALALLAELLAIVAALYGRFLAAGLLVALAVGLTMLTGSWWQRQRETADGEEAPEAAVGTVVVTGLSESPG